MVSSFPIYYTLKEISLMKISFPKKTELRLQIGALLINLGI